MQFIPLYLIQTKTRNPFPANHPHPPTECMGHSVYGSSRWETTLHCNVVPHWLSPYLKWSLTTLNAILNMTPTSEVCYMWIMLNFSAKEYVPDHAISWCWRWCKSNLMYVLLANVTKFCNTMYVFESVYYEIWMVVNVTRGGYWQNVFGAIAYPCITFALYDILVK